MSDILKYKNLLINLRNWSNWDVKNYPLSQKEAETVTDTLMKMVPIAPIEKEDGYGDRTTIVHLCPNEDCCKELPFYYKDLDPSLLEVTFVPKHCPYCGQAILWEDDNANKEG